MNPVIVVAIIGCIGTVVGPILSALITARVMRRQHISQERIQEWEQWREDNKALREESKGQSEEIRGLRVDVRDLRREVKVLEGKLDEAIGERDDLRGKLRHEQAIVGTFISHLAPYLSGEIPAPTPEVIKSLVTALKDFGWSAVLPPGAATQQPPAPKLEGK